MVDRGRADALGSTITSSASPSDAPARDYLAPGTLIANRYEIVRLIDHGGMGAVYEATDRSLHHRIALKTVSTERAYDSRAHRTVQARSAARAARHRIATCAGSSTSVPSRARSVPDDGAARGRDAIGADPTRRPAAPRSGAAVVEQWWPHWGRPPCRRRPPRLQVLQCDARRGPRRRHRLRTRARHHGEGHERSTRRLHRQPGVRCARAGRRPPRQLRE